MTPCRIKINGNLYPGAPTYLAEEARAAISAAVADWGTVRARSEQLQKKQNRLKAELKEIEGRLDELTPISDRLWPERDRLSAKRDHLRAEINLLEAACQRLRADWQHRHGIAVVYRARHPHLVAWTTEGKLIGPVVERWTD